MSRCANVHQSRKRQKQAELFIRVLGAILRAVTSLMLGNRQIFRATRWPKFCWTQLDRNPNAGEDLPTRNWRLGHLDVLAAKILPWRRQQRRRLLLISFFGLGLEVDCEFRDFQATELFLDNIFRGLIHWSNRSACLTL
uniref:Uncharacterized protein n=1 Tax=Spongospora subterranea TaxID=70186 RepID=A0A0H5QNX9_9EUKA|eukprot:CRZ03743.1 hypothetical protein [Spongospora subterranea]